LTVGFNHFVNLSSLLVELLDLSTKDGHDVGGRVAGLQLGHQRMREKVFLRLLFISFEGSIKDGVESDEEEAVGGV